MKPLINLVLVLLFNSTYCISDEVEKNKTTIWEIKAPLEMVSFGACVAERNFYVHGGHLGAPHTYSEENISKEFWRIPIDPKGKWERLEAGTPAQGFAMVSYNKKILKVGGSIATNKAGSSHNLHSVDTIEIYDIENNKWKHYDNLPDPRSSHESVIVGNTLYVIGGWDYGNGREKWLGGIQKDLADKQSKWVKMPEMPIEVRAFSIASNNQFIFIIGGMDGGGTLNDLHIYDITEKKWSKSTKFPSRGSLRGFGSAATFLSGKLYASDSSNNIYEFNNKSKTWLNRKEKLKQPRFFHRMVNYDNELYVIGGTNRKTGAVFSIESLEIKNANTTLTPYQLKGETWPSFRGNGNSTTAAKNVPTKWNDENINWTYDFEGYGQSSPVIYGNNVFVTEVVGNSKQNLSVRSLNIRSGEVNWTTLTKNINIQKINDYYSKGAPSPCVDKDSVYCFFETGHLISINFNGVINWQRNIADEYGNFTGNHGIGTSLVQSENHLILLIDHDSDGYLIKVNKHNGENEWLKKRPKRVSWTTPFIDLNSSPQEILISSNGIVESIRLIDGENLWVYEGVKKNTIPSPTVTKDLLIVGSSERPSCISLFRKKDTQNDPKQLNWVAEKASSSMSSPLVSGNYVYYVNRAGVISCNEILSGKKRWDYRLPASCWASPVAVGKNIFFFCKDGSTVVLNNNKDSSEPIILSVNKVTLDGPVYGVAIVNETVVMRTGKKLFCILN